MPFSCSSVLGGLRGLQRSGGPHVPAQQKRYRRNLATARRRQQWRVIRTRFDSAIQTINLISGHDVVVASAFSKRDIYGQWILFRLVFLKFG